MERHVIDYKILFTLRRNAGDDMETLVKSHLKTGWYLQGGLSHDDEGNLRQAMVKYAPRIDAGPK